MEDHDNRRLSDADLGLEQRLGPRRFEIGADECTGTEDAWGLERQRNRERHERQPGDDDWAAVAGAPSPKALEAVHRRRLMLALDPRGPSAATIGDARDDLHALVRELPEQ